MLIMVSYIYQETRRFCRYGHLVMSCEVFGVRKRVGGVYFGENVLSLRLMEIHSSNGFLQSNLLAEGLLPRLYTTA